MNLLDFLASIDASTEWADPLQAAMNRFNINTVDRRDMFLAQIMHESATFTRLQENLHYQGDRLLQVFPNHFINADDANTVAAKGPQAIANRIYASRMGNGDESSGDGWNYRGRGLIQLTGRANYTAAGAALDVPLVVQPDMLLQPSYAALASANFWASHGCNELADTGDIVGTTQKINGGLMGLADRQTQLARVRSAGLTF